MTRLEFMGPPGAGKGTQARRIAASVRVPHVSTGDMFRDHIRQGTPLGLRAQGFLASGNLVPDGLVSEMVVERLTQPDCAQGYVLDGYPRTLEQLADLDRFLATHGWERTAVISLSVPDEEVIARLSGRRTCSACGQATTTAAARQGTCPSCGGKLEQRGDDQENVIRERLRVYGEETAPLLAVYRSRGQLVEVDGTGPENEVFRRIQSALERVSA
jgi:adenylate kinase